MKYGKKESSFRIFSTNGIKEELIGEKVLDITPYVGRGVVRDKI